MHLLPQPLLPLHPSYERGSPHPFDRHLRLLSHFPQVILLFPFAFWSEDIDMFGRVSDSAESRGEAFLFYSYATIAGGALLIGLVAGEQGGWVGAWHGMGGNARAMLAPWERLCVLAGPERLGRCQLMLIAGAVAYCWFQGGAMAAFRGIRFFSIEPCRPTPLQPTGEAALTYEQLPAAEAAKRVMAVLRSIYEPRGVAVPAPIEVCRYCVSVGRRMGLCCVSRGPRAGA